MIRENGRVKFNKGITVKDLKLILENLNDDVEIYSDYGMGSAESVMEIEMGTLDNDGEFESFDNIDEIPLSGVKAILL